MELTLFVLEQCFIKQSTNINSGYSLPTPSGDSNQELVKTLLDQIENLKKELTHKNTIIPGLLQNRKPLSISDQKSSDNSNSNKIIESSSQNRNQDSNVAHGIDFIRNNNVNDVSINTAEECTNIQLPRIQKQLQDVRAQ